MTLQNAFDISCVSPPPAMEIAGSDRPEIAWRLINDVVRSLSDHNVESDTVRADKMRAAVEMIKAMRPSDALEAQLITQIVCAHNLASDDMYNANTRGTPKEEIARRLSSATRFMTLFRQQMKMLLAYRSTPRDGKRNPGHEAYWAEYDQALSKKQRQAEAAQAQRQEPAAKEAPPSPAQ